MVPFKMTEGSFETWDYVAFFLMVMSSCAGGLWYSAIGSRQENVEDVRDYLLGGKSMKTFPVSMSLIASYVSGVTILGTPAEVYNYGSQYWLVIIGVCLSCTIVIFVYLPVFCNLHVHSSYEYLELRFNRHVRAAASLLFLLDEILFLPMVVYVPALAFNQLTTFNVYAIGGIMVLICGVYTALGGLRAVVWTDSIQTQFMYLGTFLVAITGTIAAGGFSNVVKVASANNRFEFSNWDLSPYERQTGWGAIFGGMIYWTCFNSVNQTMVQRYVALPAKKNAVHALLIFCFGAVIAITLCVWCGLSAWTAWVTTGCTSTGSPIADDRLLPAFVTYISRTLSFPGIAGIFLAGVFGAGLSSLSAVLNACALVVIEDILRGWLRLRLKPLTEGITARLFTAALAMLSVAMLFVISKLGGVLGVATALSSIAASTTCGIFSLGMMCWWVGPRGALAGAVAGSLMSGTISFGSQAAAAKGLRSPPMPFNEQCALNASYHIATQKIDPETIFPLFRLSYHWIAPMGLATTMIVGMIMGYFLDKKDHSKMDAELFTPFVWRWLPPAMHANVGQARRAVAEREADYLSAADAASSRLLLEVISLHKVSTLRDLTLSRSKMHNSKKEEESTTSKDGASLKDVAASKDVTESNSKDTTKESC